MMYDVTVKVTDTYADAAHTAVVGFTDVAPRRGAACSSGPYKFSQPQVFDVDTRTWTLYNFQPGPLLLQGADRHSGLLQELLRAS